MYFLYFHFVFFFIYTQRIKNKKQLYHLFLRTFLQNLFILVLNHVSIYLIPDIFDLGEYQKHGTQVRFIILRIKLTNFFFLVKFSIVLFLQNANEQRVHIYVRHSIEKRFRYYYYNCFLKVKIEFINFAVN